MKINELLDVSIRADKLRQRQKAQNNKPAPKVGSKSLLTKKIKAK